MSSISIKTFVQVAEKLPPETSIMLRGPHGIGKSRIGRKLAAVIAKKLNINVADYKFIDRRLSQMSEGDVIGLPSTDGNVTRFNPPDWYMEACRVPCFLMLDELNRATNEVMQAAFQIVLDRELNGHKLHPQTRVMTCINASAAYNVNEIDPALLDRFWAVDLVPTVEDWLEWAKEECDDEAIRARKPNGKNVLESLVDFIQDSSKFLDPPKDFDPTRVTVSRRSWEKVSDSLYQSGLHDKPDDDLFYSMCVGYVGVEATIKYRDYVKSSDAHFTGEDILNSYTSKYKKRFAKSKRSEIYNMGIEKVTETIHQMPEQAAPDSSKFILTEAQGKNLRSFMDDLPGEMQINLWTKLIEKGLENMTLLRNVHKYLHSAVCGIFGVTAGPAGVGMVPNIPGLFKQPAAQATNEAAAPGEAKPSKAAITGK